MHRTLAKALLIASFFVALGAVLAYFASGQNIPVLHPAGDIAAKQRNLIFFAVGLSFFVVIPVFVLTAYIGWKYRAGNTKARYTPDWETDSRIETIWWLIPMILISILSVVTWRSSHELDPYKPLENQTKTIRVQAMALEWKWLFIYPEQHIASLNELRIPTNTQVQFEVTSSGPMNSLWIPQLAGQVYAMSGMSTHLYLNATKAGVYKGGSANISGDGFASMQFDTIAQDETAFTAWTDSVRNGLSELNDAELLALEKPSTGDAPRYFASISDNLFQTSVDKFMLYESTAHHHKEEAE